MTIKQVNVENLLPGDMLYQWTREAREVQGRFQHLASGPEGCWQSMVISNTVRDVRSIEGFGYPPVHRIDVFFWDEEGKACFESFCWTSGTPISVVV